VLARDNSATYYAKFLIWLETSPVKGRPDVTIAPERR
jgi:hypothetical protein